MKLSALFLVRSLGVALVIAGILFAQTIPAKHPPSTHPTFADTQDNAMILRLMARNR
jgi:hypothetical protein